MKRTRCVCLVAGRAAAAGTALVLDDGADLRLDRRRHLHVLVTPLGMLRRLAQHIRFILAMNHEVAIHPHILA